jgi:competence protein ComEA
MVSLYLYRYFVQYFQPCHNVEKKAGSVVVELDGDTNRRGIYFIPPDTPVSGLFKIARVADIKRFDKKDLSIVLGTGEKVVIEPENRYSPRLKIEKISASKRIALDMPIGINNATPYELTLIPGIGKKTAQAIVELRERSGEITSIGDLLKIYGIGEKKLSKIKKYLYVDGD